MQVHSDMTVRYANSNYRSQREQALHYFARPHAGPCRGLIDSPAAWLGCEMRKRIDWLYRFTERDRTEIQAALLHSIGSGKPTRELTAADFPLPVLAAKMADARETLTNGCGLQVFSGLPVRDWTDEQTQRVFWCLGLHIGVPGAQNPQGDLLGHVRDTGKREDQESGRFYKTRRAIAFHCDAADAVGLMCLQKARRGGQSRIVSSVAVFNEMLRRHPVQVGRLYRPYMLDTKGEGGVNAIPITPCCYSNGRLRTTYHSDYFRSAGLHRDVNSLSSSDLEVLDNYEAIANDPDYFLEMNLEPGDIQLISNHTVLHARTAFEDFDEPARQRHLLRLWLSLDEPLSPADRLRKLRSRLALVIAILRQRRRSA
jgi:hypothetical protein